YLAGVAMTERRRWQLRLAGTGAEPPLTRLRRAAPLPHTTTARAPQLSLSSVTTTTASKISTLRLTAATSSTTTMATGLSPTLPRKLALPALAGLPAPPGAI